jgi:putative ABC transport system permease protein
VALHSRTLPPPDTLTAAVARADVDVRVWSVEKLDELIARNNNGMSFVSGLFLSFAVLALLLAGSGIYAVTARSVQLRTQEIGVRRALGANERDVFRLLFKESGRQFAIGGGLGLLLGAMLVKLLSTVLYNFAGEAPLLFAAVVAILGGIVGVATLVPALRAVWIPPNVALHHT